MASKNRVFSPITKEELRAKVEKAFGERISPSLLREKLGKDLKVEFDFENFECREDDFGPDGLMGLQSWPNGLTFLGMAAGGDWEHPVYFVVYWDGKRLRGYVPTAGNPWNTTTKKAYGNDAKADLANAKKRWPDSYAFCEEVEPSDFDFSPVVIKEDLENRFSPAVGVPHPILPKDAQAKIESCVYYGTGDEGYELFQQAWGFAYSLCGVGMSDKAETVADWATEMAAASKTWWLEDGNRADDLSDSAKGHWGYN